MWQMSQFSVQMMGMTPVIISGPFAYHFGLSARLLKSFYKRRMEPMSATMITTPLFAEPLRGLVALQRTSVETARDGLEMLAWTDGALYHAWRLGESLRVAAGR
jgi:hypothetical protein